MRGGLIIVAVLLMCAGCSAVGSRVHGAGTYFSGVRADSAMLFEPDEFDPESRYHPVLIVIDFPFSFVGDIFFLPYDFWSNLEAENGK